MGGSFSDFSDHPALLGWEGVRLDDGRLTTAAGAYQITRTTWKDLGGAAKYGSFDPAAQDAAAMDLLKRRGALNLVKAGQFDTAVARLTNEWEAFARILAGNYNVTPEGARAIYADAGGTIAG
jgi:lysozyme